MSLKQVIIVRQDLQLPKGKLASQVAHASVEATLQSQTETVKKWRKEGMAKIVLKVNDEKELLEYSRFAKDAGLVVAVITDAGRTTIAPGTTTCAGIGPAEEKEIDKTTGVLKLL
ncbi:peptidyl-tRNA hydrolase [Candidatus Woesearchaeota archaeon]|nr:peptidyl-tRNA hydrolase [Candidatus Woesearchaeota archaeon]